MTKPGKNVEIVNRQTDRLVEACDAFAVPALRFTKIRLGMVKKITFVWRQGTAQQLRYR
jgi:hypothetical protein